MVMVMVMVIVVTVILRRGIPLVRIVARVSAPGGEQEEGIHPAPRHREHGRAWPETGANLVDDLLKPRGLQPVGPAHEHEVSGFQLILEQILDRPQVIEAGVRPALGFHRLAITHHMTCGKGFAIHHGHHRMDAGTGPDSGPAKRGHQGFGKGQSAGFHHDAVEVVGPLEQAEHGGQELILDGAAEAAVGKFHQAAVEFFGLTEAAGGQQVTINADFTELVDQHGELQTALQQQVTQQGGLAGAQETGHYGDREPAGRG